MFEIKYFGKIDSYERAEGSADLKPFKPFNLEELGTETIIRRATRRFIRWFFLFTFAVLRTVSPVARFGRLVVVTRHADVIAVLKDAEHFRVPFGPEMRAITGGEDFMLGIDGPAHDAQREIILKAVLPGDVSQVLGHTRNFTEALLKNSGGRIDAIRDLLGRVFTETCSEYFGLDLDEPNAFMDRTMAVSALIFADPFGNEDWRRLTLNGAVRVRYLIDRAIDRAVVRVQTSTTRHTVIDRLVGQMQSGHSKLTKGQIRAIAIGTIIGLIPTNVLGAGKILEEVLRRDLLQSLIGAASAAERARREGDMEQMTRHRRALRDILFEASRLNPALQPGHFRHAPKGATIGGKEIPAGSFVVASTFSALRDGRQFDSPGEFRPGRAIEPTLMFGDASHHCIGAHLAMEQITEIFQILFSQPGIRLALHPAGLMSYVGPFPRRLDFQFEPAIAPAMQKLVTIQAPIPAADYEDVKHLIETSLGNPAAPDGGIGKALKETEVVHFASLSVFDAADPEDKNAAPDPRLVFELNVDGEEDVALDRIVEKAGPLLEPVFRRVAGSGDASLATLFRRHKTTLHSLPWGPIGLNFNGTPDCPVADIERQNEVAAFARDALDQHLRVHRGAHKRAMDALNYVRSLTRDYELSPSKVNTKLSVEDREAEKALRTRGRHLRPFLIRPTRRRLKVSEWMGYDAKVGWQGLPGFLRSNAGLFLGVLLVATFALQGGTIHYAVKTGTWIAAVVAFAGALTGAVIVGSLFFRDGFDRLVRAGRMLAECVAWLATLLLFVLSATLFMVLLLARWAGWPAVLLAGGLASFWMLERWLPELSLATRIILAAAGGASVAFVVAILRLLITRYWQIAAALLVGMAVSFWALQSWAPSLSLAVQVGLAVVGGVLVAMPSGRKARAEAHSLFQRYPRAVRWGLRLAALVLATLVVLQRFDMVVAWVAASIAEFGALALAVSVGIGATFLIWLIPTIVLLAMILWHEMRDVADERTAPLKHIENIAAKENPPGYAQNHITAVTVMKPGAFRKLTLALTLWAIGKEIQYWFRPGFVLNMGTIHYARWFRLPGSEMMIFLANYDGSWQSYLEDFATKANEGQSAVWSHGKGFPKTRLLVFGGADDADRFKRWVRRQQVVTQFWYSRFPELTTDQIRTNALIHDGLMRAQTDTAARAWLDCFGSMPRPADAIETDEVQSLVFRGLPSHQHMICAAMTFSDSADARVAWLQTLPEKVTFGERPDVFNTAATFVAFSAEGIAKCLDCTEPQQADAMMTTFPPVFRLGMASRANVLGDVGRSAPRKWEWADRDRADARDGADKAVDAMLLIYGRDFDQCEAVLKEHMHVLNPRLCRTVVTQPTHKTREAAKPLTAAKAAGQTEAELVSPMYEHFGFRDGISQPVIRGSQREALLENKSDVVEPGELILGYRSSAGYRAPAITLPAERDEGDDLETDTPDFPSRYPRFAGSQDADMRDFGRNGTFIAVRKLRQDVNRFRMFLEDQTKKLKKYHGIEASIGGPISPEWIAAKMMGRWQTGASLVAWPHNIAGKRTPSKADNDFNFAADDPQGLLCPFGAHIRRANPRGSLAPNDPAQAEIEKRHRLLRRGRTYGDEADRSEKGLLFVGICADLERQFEFLQQTWVGSPYFHGLSSEPDPFTSAQPNPADDRYVFTIPTPAGTVTIKGLKSFVSVRAGGYFFMPGRSAVRFLARLPAQAPTPTTVMTVSGGVRTNLDIASNRQREDA